MEARASSSRRSRDGANEVSEHPCRSDERNYNALLSKCRVPSPVLPLKNSSPFRVGGRLFCGTASVVPDQARAKSRRSRDGLPSSVGHPFLGRGQQSMMTDEPGPSSQPRARSAPQGRQTRGCLGSGHRRKRSESYVKPGRGASTPGISADRTFPGWAIYSPRSDRYAPILVERDA